MLQEEKRQPWVFSTDLHYSVGQWSFLVEATVSYNVTIM